jgi:peptidyl-tRNA hydrolase, PTH1 family
MEQPTRNFRGIVGLGNPGRRYLKTRHNAGFQVIDRIFQKYSGLGWKLNDKGWISTACIKGNSVRLLKPATFMNQSGLAVMHFIKTNAIDPTEMIVIHDDLDIDLQKIRVKSGGGHAGHKGVKSIIENIKTGDFCRVRVGIGRPEKENTVDFVLSSPQNEQEAVYQKTLEMAVTAVETIFCEGLKSAMDVFNKKQ